MYLSIRSLAKQQEFRKPFSLSFPEHYGTHFTGVKIEMDIANGILKRALLEM